MRSPLQALKTNPAIQLTCMLAAGALQTLSLAPFNIWVVGPLSVVLLLWASQALSPNHRDSEAGKSSSQNTCKGIRHPAWHGYFFGLGLFLSGASWVYISIHTYGYASPPLAASLTLVFVAGLALFHALQFYLMFRLKGPSLSLNALLFVALWVLSDAFRSVFLTGFPWLFLGYGHLETPLAGWIPVLGVHGLTAITVASGVVLYLALQLGTKLRQQPKLVAITSVVVLLWLVGPLLNQVKWTTETGKSLTASLLQINIPQELKWLPSQRRKTLALLDEMSRENWESDIIVWPETAIPLLFDQALPYLDRLAEEAKQQHINIITGIPYRQTDPVTHEHTLHNSIYSMGAGSGINHKQKLVPFGEYVPLQDLLRGLIAFFDLPMSDFRKGPADQALLRSHNYRVAPFICYEVVYPDFVAQRSRDADYLLTISNDSWFGASIGPLQHLEMARMRAAENGKYMLRGTNNGISAVIDHKGNILAETEQFVRTSLSAPISIFSGNTPYTRTGSWPILILSILLAGLSALQHIKARSRGRR